MNFQDKLDKIQEKNNSLVCVGLDSNIDKLSDKFKQLKYPQFEFNKWVIEQTNSLICAYKPNLAFYEAKGDQGMKELKMTLEYLQEKHPDIVTIADGKRADIGSSNEGYVKAIFDWLGFDGVTLQPYLGREALEPFLNRKDKGCIVLCRTSNPGSGELQDLETQGKPLWQVVAEKVSKDWDENNNLMLVAGATYPEELGKIREIVGEMTLLVPGVGAQGGDIEKTVKAGINSKGAGMIINSSRGIIFNKNPRLAAEQLRDTINRYRK